MTDPSAPFWSRQQVVSREYGPRPAASPATQCRVRWLCASVVGGSSWPARAEARAALRADRVSQRPEPAQQAAGICAWMAAQMATAGGRRQRGFPETGQMVPYPQVTSRVIVTPKGDTASPRCVPRTGSAIPRLSPDPDGGRHAPISRPPSSVSRRRLPPWSPRWRIDAEGGREGRRPSTGHLSLQAVGIGAERECSTPVRFSPAARRVVILRGTPPHVGRQLLGGCVTWLGPARVSEAASHRSRKQPPEGVALTWADSFGVARFPARRVRGVLSVSITHPACPNLPWADRVRPEGGFGVG